MPTGTRIRGNNVFGVTTDNPLSAGATSFNSLGLQYLPVVTGNHAVITLDPLRRFGNPEIIIVTNHTVASTTATIIRGAYGTIARAHPEATVWTHAPITEDFTSILTSAGRPADPYIGELIYETDTLRTMRYSGTAWQQDGLYFDPPACRVFHSVNQSCGNAVSTTLAFDSESYDTANMHSTTVSNSRITIPVAGLYLVTFTGEYTAGTDYIHAAVSFRLNGGTAIAVSANDGTVADGAIGPWINGSFVYKFALNDFIEVAAFQRNGAAAARNMLRQSDYSAIFSATWIGRGN